MCLMAATLVAQNMNSIITEGSIGQGWFKAFRLQKGGFLLSCLIPG